ACLTLLLALFLAGQFAADLCAASWDPAAADYTGRKGKTIYVSKLGDDSDGSSWPRAFRTIQAALSAVPDERGGHCIVVRPDTYVEANLFTSHKGAPGSYNLLIGDVDGRFGSGAVGRVVIDSSDPEKGFKSYDWWGTIRATTQGWSPQHTAPTFSAIGWDRWILRNLYATGGDGGLFWDLTNKSGEGFTVIMEDCVSIGRAFGAGFGYQVTRKGEPIVFRRCFLMALDWWGDAGALGVGSYNNSPPEDPDVICEDCTMAAPDNAVQILFPSKYIRVRLKDCRLMSLNFSQPRGTPSSGVISSNVEDPKQVHVDFEGGLLMGFRLFGTCDPKINKTPGKGTGAISYSVQGKVGAYVQFEQPTPPEFERLGLWPVDAFRLLDPQLPKAAFSASSSRPKRPRPPAVPGDPSAPGYAGRRGVTLYVSKAGDNSDGTSWAKAFRTIQAALSAIPDDRGGHRVIIRPDTYPEANLYPAHRGAPGAYNLLVGDFDGSLGSGASGWVVIDSGCPGVAVRTDPTRQGTFKIVSSKLPESGLKCVDWWGPWHCDPYFSGAIWDRWIYRNLYCTGSEGGIGWDMTCQKGAEFSAVVDNCVGIGRFAGAAVMAHSPRKAEPVLFRQCYFLNLDWWGDAGGVYVRGESRAMPDCPHAVFDDCTIISPDNALQAGWPGVDDLCTRVAFKDCRLIVLNFSQPQGTPSSGIVCCGCKEGRQLHVDFENSTLVGYKVFGTRRGEVSYSTRGKVEAYVQFQQTVPDGFVRLARWPVEVFDSIRPPATP
ncbi:MAG: hypothetical protein NUV77_00885, partial [Thermoguttaceae bacterium]|nr:hypothetical protein [Thermoguttaceae bacterium]